MFPGLGCGKVPARELERCGWSHMYITFLVGNVLHRLIKYPGKRQLKGEGEDFSLQFQVADHHSRESRQELEVASPLQGQEQKEMVHVYLFMFSSFL